ncbi:MAG: bifunctional pyr operon transcriptional regulator/uracil phosphoribosyltransferase PyrR [Candidatus Methylacidiphilales bacterium]|nr:bifunctional pyr operon transcriptional regulator/uracil phosphoribosyltransferase PyrR [Candidatus Methylacidiphilales bacterium]
MSKTRNIWEAADMARSLNRLAHEVLERNPPERPIALVGIQTRGVPLAARLTALIRQFDPARVLPEPGRLDISFHRDDLAAPVPKETDIRFDLNGLTVILVDDVLYTGRTIRAALNALTDLGRPRAIQLAVLVDRGHRELPIRADYVGKNLPTTRGQEVIVRVKEVDGSDEVVLQEGREREAS